MKVFGEVWTTHMILDSSGINSRGETPRFNTLGFVQGVEAELDKHKRVTIMFKHVIKYNVHMTNILFRLFNLEIKNNHIIEKKHRSVQNLQGALEKE
jgi:hypothetical protein